MIEKNEKILAAIRVFMEGKQFESPTDLEKQAYAFACGWRAYHRQHRGNRIGQRQRRRLGNDQPIRTP